MRESTKRMGFWEKVHRILIPPPPGSGIDSSPHQFFKEFEEAHNRSIDPNSEHWFLSNPAVIGVLMKMLNGSYAQGENEALDNAVFEFIATPMIATGSVKSFFRRGNGDPDFVQWLSEFGEEYPDAANLIRKATRKAGWYKET